DFAIQSIDFPIHAVDLPIHAVDFALDPVEPRFDRREVVAVAAGLFENVARDHLLALDLALDDTDARFEFFAGHLGSHCSILLADRYVTIPAPGRAESTPGGVTHACDLAGSQARADYQKTKRKQGSCCARQSQRERSGMRFATCPRCRCAHQATT